MGPVSTNPEHVDQVRGQIRDFNAAIELEKVIGRCTGNTERFTELREGLNVTWDDLHAAIKAGESEVFPLDRRGWVMWRPGTPALATERKFVSS